MTFDEEAIDPNPDDDLPTVLRTEGAGPDAQAALLSRRRQTAQLLGKGFRKEMLAHVMHAYAHYYFRKRKYSASLGG